jgi:hypothetical protein
MRNPNRVPGWTAVLALTWVAWAPEAARAQSAIVFRAAATSANDSFADTITVDKPAATATNDVMIASVFVRGALADIRKTSVVDPPAGWTLIRRDDYSIDVVGGGSTMVSYYRVAVPSDPARFTWKFDTARLAAAGIVSYAGVSTSSPVDAHGGKMSQLSAYSTTIGAPSITTTRANTVVVGFYGLHKGGHIITPPAAMTERAQRTSPEMVAGPRPFASNLTFEIADELRATPGATPNRDATATAPDTSVAQLIALAPAGNASGTSPVR